MDETKAETLRETFMDNFDAPDGVTFGNGEYYPKPCPGESDEDWKVAYLEKPTHIVSVYGLAGSDALQPFYETEEDMWWGEPGDAEQVAVDVEQEMR